MIVATAGHVDHGKTTLVRALTGVDTDRLAEERRRGLTIEPGFAYLDVADERWGFVDVPGHHRFVANMLTGAAGVDAALLVVAADDGPMPQTREHLAILELLGVQRLVVALSKCDLVEPARIAEVEVELEVLLTAAGFPGARRVQVSAPQGRGLDTLRQALSEVAGGLQDRSSEGPFRFAIDRAFSIKGAGVVVTGFVHSGSIATGDPCTLLPTDTQVRVRSIRAQDLSADTGLSGERLAINLSGVDLDAVQRGAWLCAATAAHQTQRFDARLRCLPEVELRSGMEVHIHHGTGRSLGRLTLLDGDAASPRVHVSTRMPLAPFHGDRFVVRDAAAHHTLAGGRVLDHAPPARGRSRPTRLAELDALEADGVDAVIRALHHLHPLDLDVERFATLLALSPESVQAILPDAVIDRQAGRLHARNAAAFGELVDAIVDALTRFHAGNPQLAGMGPDELRAVLPSRPAPQVLDAALAAALQAGRIERNATRFQASGHRAALKGDDAQRWARIRPHLAQALTQPPVVHDLARTLDESPVELAALLARVHHTGEAVRVADNRFMLPEGLARLARDAARCADAAAEGMFEARDFKRVAGIGRNLAIDVLEFFDRSGLTRRRGNARLLVGSAEDLFGTVAAGDDPAA